VLDAEARHHRQQFEQAEQLTAAPPCETPAVACGRP
jgi:hypothetical protein